MASGFHELQVNTLERASSDDINRLQKFKGRDLAELFRYLWDVSYGTDDVDAEGATTEYSIQETPVRAEIIGGLTVRPQLGSFSIFVEAGVIFILDPDAASDDSDYKFIADPGVSTLGALVIGGNASVSTRIDVIECRKNPVDTTVTASKDIYNTTTGLLVATSVTKEKKGQLEYRVRQGTAGSGYPAAQAGWLPLAVASVPSGAASCDDVTFWDVRPLIADRMQNQQNIGLGLPLFTRNFVRSDTVSGNVVIGGVIDVLFNGRKVGGRLRRGTPGVDGTDFNFIDLQDSANFSSGFAYPGSGLAYGYLLFPFGLPRWARYTDPGTGARKPRGCKGLFCMSTIAPTHAAGVASLAVNLPTSTGLGSSTTNAICIFVTPSPGVPTGGVADGRYFMPASSVSSVSPTTNILNTVTFALTEGTTHPPHAKALRICLAGTFPVPATTDVSVVANVSVGTLTTAGYVTFIGDRGSLTNSTGGVLGRTFGFVIDVPLESAYPGSSPTNTVSWTHSTGLTATSAIMRVQGWVF